MLSILIVAALQASPAPATPADVTVTGRRLEDYAADLAACTAARCPPRADIVASIRYAEALFRRGDYGRARDVLGAATRRNAGAGAREPIALSQLYLAQANVAAHYGEQRDVQRATFASARVTHDFLPAGHPDRLWADLRVADWRATREPFGERAYVPVAAAARAAGQPVIAAAADLHQAWLLHAKHADTRALAILAGVAASKAEDTRPYRLAARVLAARIARARGDKGTIDSVIAEMRAEPALGAPVLVYSPPLPSPTDPVARDRTALLTDTTTRSSDYTGLSWVDIGFGIRPDGTVDTPEVLRGSRTTGWAQPLLAMIAGRRYSPTNGSDDLAGHYRIERYSLTANFGVPAGSLIRRRVGTPRFEQLDLTETAQAD